MSNKDKNAEPNIPSLTWKVSYRKLNADYWDIKDAQEKLLAAVAKFLSSPFMKGTNDLVVTMNWADVEDLARAYDEACGYSHGMTIRSLHKEAT